MFKAASYKEELYRAKAIREKEMHQLYVDDLIDAATDAARDLGCLDTLKIPVYGDPCDHHYKDDTAVLWQ